MVGNRFYRVTVGIAFNNPFLFDNISDIEGIYCIGRTELSIVKIADFICII